MLIILTSKKLEETMRKAWSSGITEGFNLCLMLYGKYNKGVITGSKAEREIAQILKDKGV